MCSGPVCVVMYVCICLEMTQLETRMFNGVSVVLIGGWEDAVVSPFACAAHSLLYHFQTLWFSSVNSNELIALVFDSSLVSFWLPPLSFFHSSSTRSMATDSHFSLSLALSLPHAVSKCISLIWILSKNCTLS